MSALRRIWCMLTGHVLYVAPGLVSTDPDTGRWIPVTRCRRCGWRSAR